MEDKKTIGVSTDAQAVLQEIASGNPFPDEMAAARFAFAIALSKGCGTEAVTGSTKWNVGSFDPDGQLKKIVLMCDPDCRAPYRRIEELVDSGLRWLGRHCEKFGRIELSDCVLVEGEAP